MFPACTGRKTGGGFVTGREQKARLFSESGGRYTSPRPSSFVPRRAGRKRPKEADRRASVKAGTSRLRPALTAARRPAGRQSKRPIPLTVLGRCLFQLGAVLLPKSKEAGKHPWGLPALMTDKQNRAGLSMAAHKVRRSSRPLTAPAGFAILPVQGRK